MIPTAALRQRITITPFEGDGGLGPQYGEPVTDVPARFVGKRHVMRKPDGTDVISSAVADIRPTRVVPTQSKVTYGDSTYEVLDVVDVVELARTHHRSLILDGPR